MIGVYGDIMTRLTPLALDLGFELVEDSDFLARFARDDGWTIIMEGDRAAYPAFTLSVARRRFREGTRIYALWLLMGCFTDRLPPERTKPSIDNQLWFLEHFADTIFGDEQSYRACYVELDEAPL